MQSLRCLALLAVLVAPQALADTLYRVELILFRHAAALEASRPAPPDWAHGTRLLARADERAPALHDVAARLSPDRGYQILMQRAWQQRIANDGETIALTQGDRRFEHYPLQGRLKLRPGRYIQADAVFWVNRFGEHGQLLASERLQQRVRLEPRKLNYMDHDSLGLLIELKPL